MDIQQIKADIIEGVNTTRKTCELIRTRMVDMYVIAHPSDGAVLHTTGGVRPFGKSVAEVERSRDRKAVETLLKHVREHNDGNSVVGQLEIMSWKKAARLQEAILDGIIERLA